MVISGNETKLDFTIDERELYLLGFEIIRKDRKINGRNGGGVCFYVRSNLNYKTREDLSTENLEWLALEITRPRSRPFLVATWYRPPDSPVSLFNEFEELVNKVDAGNWEFFLLGDLKVDLMVDTTSANAVKLKYVYDIYGLDQLITEPTRITLSSRSLIDLCITNTPTKVAKSGVVHIAISDHALIYMTYKVQHERAGTIIIKTRQMKNFHKASFLRDLQEKAWSDVETQNNPNDMWSMWKDMLMQAIDKHAPLKTKRAGIKKSPWITDHLRREMRRRDFLKKESSFGRLPFGLGSI